MELLLFAAIFWILPIWVGQMIGAKKGRAGWAWGLLLGWIGVVIVAVLPSRDPQHVQITDKQRQVLELEAEVRLAELRKRQAELQQV
jgi:hypothetical protein